MIDSLPLACIDFGAVIVTPSSGPLQRYLQRYVRCPHRAESEQAIQEAMREMRFVCEAVKAVRARGEG